MQDKTKLTLMQNLVLWQQLNKQILAFSRPSGGALGRYRSQYLKTLCFEQELMSRLGSVPITRDIPVDLFTDFSDLCFVSLQSKSWRNLLTSLLSKHRRIWYLDLERALARAFNDINKYADKFDLLDRTAPDKDRADEDEALYAAMDYYFSARKRLGLDFTKLVIDLHELKASVIKHIVKDVNHIQINADEEGVFLNLSDYKHGTEEKYLENFCERARDRVREYAKYMVSLQEPSGNLGANSIIKMITGRESTEQKLDELRDEMSRLKRLPSGTTPTSAEQGFQFEQPQSSNLQAFIEHEEVFYSTELTLIKESLNQILYRLRSGYESSIYICSPNPFAFLKNPLPIA